MKPFFPSNNTKKNNNILKSQNTAIAQLTKDKNIVIQKYIITLLYLKIK